MRYTLLDVHVVFDVMLAATVTVGVPYTVVWGSQLVHPLVHMGVGAGANAPR
jgi:hypothetical protein